MSENSQQPKKRELIEWRYNKEWELASKGATQSEIAQILKLNKSTISKDFKKLRKQAKSGINKYIEEKLPFEHQKTLVGLDEVIKQGWAFALNNDNDAKIRLQALTVISDAYMKKQAILGDPAQIEKAIKVVSKLRQQIHENNNSSEPGQEVQQEAAQ